MRRTRSHGLASRCLRDSASPNVATTRLPYASVNGTLFFTASTPVGVELWKTDGAAGTVLVADLFPGSISSTPMSLTAFNGKLLFNGFNGLNGNELWISDGSADEFERTAAVMVPGAVATQWASQPGRNVTCRSSSP
jgi:ELWxxDGT repeat protein